MYERREFRRRRGRAADQETPRRYGGGWMTFMSFFAIMACLAVLKARNPGLSIGPMLLMIGGTGIACLVMFRLNRRNRTR
ncbi:MAG: hypothetical protein LBQ56_05950 [Synergistaceae bacterium]|jgi:hypothetical protein|nr:hypothetical protein [Synergistaceae bacterium]